METERVAQILREMGTLLEISGENAFRCRSYANAAEALRGLPSDLSELVAEGRLSGIAGIGTAMQSKIARLVTTGKLEEYEQLKKAVPPDLVAMLRIPGLGAKKIKALRDALGIVTLSALREAAEMGHIAGVKGFGAKTQAQILEGLDFIASVGERILQSTARRLIDPVIALVLSQPQVIRAEVCGSLRRCAETIGDLDILFSSDQPGPVLQAFVTMPRVAKVLAHGETKASVRLADGVQCDLRGVSDVQYPFALHYFTGSKTHNIAMRRRAISLGYKLSEYGLEGPSGLIPCATEADIFAALGLAEIPPELREDLGELELAAAKAIPQLITLQDIRGAFHCHTDWSDGANTLEEMALAAQSRGWNFLGIADHSRSAGYANGLSPERLHKQGEAIDKLNAQYKNSGFRLWKGTECDILTDGSLDYPDEILAGLDYVVASIHSSFRQPRAEMTARLVKAVRNPHVTMLGHATGRLLLARAGYDCDLDEVFKAAAETQTYIEINANPHRLDLDPIACRKAHAMGVPIVINPDAHETDGLDDVSYGVSVARRAGLTARDLLNTADNERIALRLKNPQIRKQA